MLHLLVFRASFVVEQCLENVNFVFDTLLHAKSLIIVLVIAASYWYTPEISFTLALLSNAIVGINLYLFES